MAEIPDAPLLSSVGKAYYFSGREAVLNELKAQTEKTTKDIAILQNTKAYVDKKAAETEEALKELLQ